LCLYLLLISKPSNNDGKYLIVFEGLQGFLPLGLCHLQKAIKLVPFLFAIFFNDLEDFLENHNVTGLLTISQDIENIMNIYMNIFLLLYADDTVLNYLLTICTTILPARFYQRPSQNL
jgi:hypothetical protein